MWRSKVVEGFTPPQVSLANSEFDDFCFRLPELSGTLAHWRSIVKKIIRFQRTNLGAPNFRAVCHPFAPMPEGGMSMARLQTP